MLPLIITVLVVVLVSVYAYRSWNRLRTTLGGSGEQRRDAGRAASWGADERQPAC